MAKIIIRKGTENLCHHQRTLKEMRATVKLKVFEGRPHTLSRDEIEKANRVVFK